MRIGIGRDIHELAAPGKLVLGGVLVDSTRGAVAHSDGDALIHAVIDALLGAAALGDIGDHFPDSDPQYKDIDSRLLLRKAVSIVASHGWQPAQLDATVILERPKLGRLKQEMRDALAAELDLPVGAVNVKAKTAEGLDAVGRGEAVAAEAVVTLTTITER